MTIQTFKNKRLYYGGYSLGKNLSSLSVDVGRDSVDVTGIEHLSRVFLAGLKNLGFTAEGPHDVDLDAGLFALTGISDIPITWLNTPSEGQVAYFFKAGQAKYTPPLLGGVGDAQKMTIDAMAQSGLNRGTLLALRTGLGASGNGTAFQLGAVATGQKLVAVAHCLSLSGGSPSLSLNIDSDSANTFSGGGTNRITFTPFTGTGAQYVEIDGPVTDTWYRAEWAPTGTTADIVIAAAIV